MSNNLGTPKSVTRVRLKLINDNIKLFWPDATDRERIVLLEIKKQGNGATTQALGKAVGLHRSTVNAMLVAWELAYQAKPVEAATPTETTSIEFGYEIITDLRGDQYVPLTAYVKARLDAPVVEPIKTAEPVRVNVHSVTYTKNSTRDLVAISVYIDKNNESAALTDLFDWLGTGDQIGIIPAS